MKARLILLFVLFAGSVLAQEHKPLVRDQYPREFLDTVTFKEKTYFEDTLKTPHGNSANWKAVFDAWEAGDLTKLNAVDSAALADVILSAQTHTAEIAELSDSLNTFYPKSQVDFFIQGVYSYAEGKADQGYVDPKFTAIESDIVELQSDGLDDIASRGNSTDTSLVILKGKGITFREDAGGPIEGLKFLWDNDAVGHIYPDPDVSGTLIIDAEDIGIVQVKGDLQATGVISTQNNINGRDYRLNSDRDTTIAGLIQPNTVFRYLGHLYYRDSKNVCLTCNPDSAKVHQIASLITDSFISDTLFSYYTQEQVDSIENRIFLMMVDGFYSKLYIDDLFEQLTDSAGTNAVGIQTENQIVLDAGNTQTGNSAMGGPNTGLNSRHVFSTLYGYGVGKPNQTFGSDSAYSQFDLTNVFGWRAAENWNGKPSRFYNSNLMGAKIGEIADYIGECTGIGNDLWAEINGIYAEGCQAMGNAWGINEPDTLKWAQYFGNYIIPEDSSLTFGNYMIAEKGRFKVPSYITDFTLGGIQWRSRWDASYDFVNGITTNNYASIAGARIGNPFSAPSSRMYIAHSNMFSATNYALRQESNGPTHLNAPAGHPVTFDIGNNPIGFYTGTEFSLTNRFNVTSAGGNLVSQFNSVNSTTSFSGTNAAAYFSNSNTTDGNWTRLNFGDGDVVPAASIGVEVTNHGNDYGNMYFFTRGSSGILTSMSLFNSGLVNVPTSNSMSTLASTPSFQIGVTNSSNMAFDANSIQTRLNGAAASLLLNEFGGPVGIGKAPGAFKLDVAGEVNFDGDVEISNSSAGLILKSADGTQWRISVDNSGNLVTTSIP